MLTFVTYTINCILFILSINIFRVFTFDLLLFINHIFLIFIFSLSILIIQCLFNLHYDNLISI